MCFFWWIIDFGAIISHVGACCNPNNKAEKKPVHSIAPYQSEHSGTNRAGALWHINKPLNMKSGYFWGGTLERGVLVDWPWNKFIYKESSGADLCWFLQPHCLRSLNAVGSSQPDSVGLPDLQKQSSFLHICFPSYGSPFSTYDASLEDHVVFGGVFPCRVMPVKYENVFHLFCGGARAAPMILWFPISGVCRPTTVILLIDKIMHQLRW